MMSLTGCVPGFGENLLDGHIAVDLLLHVSIYATAKCGMRLFKTIRYKYIKDRAAVYVGGAFTGPALYMSWQRKFLIPSEIWR